jgi:hypothetical protein
VEALPFFSVDSKSHILSTTAHYRDAELCKLPLCFIVVICGFLAGTPFFLSAVRFALNSILSFDGGPIQLRNPMTLPALVHFHVSALCCEVIPLLLLPQLVFLFCEEMQESHSEDISQCGLYEMTS